MSIHGMPRYLYLTVKLAEVRNKCGKGSAEELDVLDELDKVWSEMTAKEIKQMNGYLLVGREGWYEDIYAITFG